MQNSNNFEMQSIGDCEKAEDRMIVFPFDLQAFLEFSRYRVILMQICRAQ